MVFYECLWNHSNWSYWSGTSQSDKTAGLCIKMLAFSNSLSPTLLNLIGKLHILQYLFFLLLLSFSLVFELPPRHYTRTLAPPPHHLAGPLRYPAALAAAPASSSSAGLFLKWQSLSRKHSRTTLDKFVRMKLYTQCSSWASQTKNLSK